MTKKKTVTLIAPPKLEACQESIAVLEQLLEKARAGKLDGLAAVLSYPQHEGEPATFGTVFVENQRRDKVGFLGMMEVLKTRMLHLCMIPERDGDGDDD